MAPTVKAPAGVMFIAPDPVMSPMLTRLPLLSILCVPLLAPVLIPVVPFMVVPDMELPVEIVPKPEAIEPLARAPVPVMAVVTASLTSTRAVSLPSSRLNSVALTVIPFRMKVELLLPTTARVPVKLPMEVLAVPVALTVVVPAMVRPAKDGLLLVDIPCLVSTTPLVMVKLLVSKLAIPLVPVVVAVSRVIVPAE